MKLTIRGYDPIVIPDKLLQPMSNGLKQHTSYISKIAARWKSRSYVTDKLPSKLLCLESVRDRARGLGGYTSYLDMLAGVGMSARVFEAPKTMMKLNDFDTGCCEVLRVNCPQAVVTSYDIVRSKQIWIPADLVFLDFNDYTLKRGVAKYRGVVEMAAGVTRDFLVLNDCTPFYFRYGKDAFKVYSQFMNKKLQTVEDYFRALVPFYEPLGLFLIHVAYFKDSSFQLWSKRPLPKRTPLSLKKIEHSPLGMVQVNTGGQLF